MAVDPAAAEPRDQHAGQRQRDGQQAEIVRAGVDDQDGRHRQRGARDARADGRDALRAPQQQEIAMAPQAAARPPARRARRAAAQYTPARSPAQPLAQPREQRVVEVDAPRVGQLDLAADAVGCGSRR